MWRTLGSQCAVAFSCSRSVFVGLPRIAFHDAHSLRRTFASDAPEQDELRAIIRASFAKDAGAAASVIASELELTNQARVLHAFEDKTASANLSPKYLHDLFQHADENADGILSRQELARALKVHGTLGEDNRTDPPTREDKIRIFLSSAIPFVGFGFLDNLIMILAGDTIDVTVGAAFSLSTMAAAGLGNMVSDVAAIFCADAIELRCKAIRWARMPSLSPHQLSLPSVRYIKTLGAVLGISFGCILGMAPLLFLHAK